MSKIKRPSLCGSARLSGPYALIGRQDKSALPSQSSTAARSFHSPRRAAACAGKANSHVVVKDADVHRLDELRAARRAAVVRDDDDDEGEEPPTKADDGTHSNVNERRFSL